MTTFRNEIATPSAIDWENPLADKFRLLANYADGTLDELIQPENGVTTSDAVTYDADGVHLTTSSTSINYANYNTSSWENVTVVAHVRNDNNTGWILQIGASTYSFKIDNSGGGLVITKDNSGGDCIVNAPSLGIASQFVTVVVSYEKGVGIKYSTSTGFSGTTADVGSFRSMTGGSVYVKASSLGEATYGMFGVSDQILSPEEINTLIADPYALFKTQEDVNEEYALVFSNLANTHITFEEVTPVGDFECEIDFIYNGDSQVLLGKASDANDVLRLGATSVLVKASGTSTSKAYVTVPTIGTRYKWLFTRVGGIYDIFDESGTSIFVSEVANANDWTFGGFGSFQVTNNPFGGNLYALKIIDPSDTTNSRFWEFNQTKGDYVKDHINGAIANLVNFPVDSGYIRGSDGNIAGYQFGGSTTALLLLTDAYTGTVTYADDSTIGISGSGNYTLDSTHVLAVKSVAVTDAVATFHFDGTTGDDTKIIDTVGGNHALITNDSTIKWQPVLPVEVYTIGGDGWQDYASVGTGMTALENPIGSINYTLKVTGDSVEDKDKYINNTNLVDVIWNIEGDTVFDGTKASVHKLSNAGGKLTYVFYEGNQSVNIKNLYLERPSIAPNTVLTNMNASIDRCYVDALFIEDIAFHNRWSNQTVKSSIIHGSKSSADNGNTDYIDSIVIDCAGKYSGFSNIGSNGNDVCTAINTISVLTTNHYNYGVTTPKTIAVGVTGSNNVTSDDAATTLGIGTQDALLGTYFTDPDNDDYTINDTGQTALKGAGWNGTDIVSWAYAIDQGGAVTFDFNTALSASLLDSFSLTTATTVGFDEVNSTSTVDDLSLSVSATLTFNEIGSSSLVDQFVIDTAGLVTHTFNPINSTSTIDDLSFSTRAVLAFNEVASTTTTDSFGLVTATTLGFNEITSTSNVENLGLTTTVNLSFNSVDSTSTADQYGFSTSTTMAFDEINSSSLLGQLDVTTTTTITLNSIYSSSTIAQFNVFEPLPHFELNALAFSFSVDPIHQITIEREQHSIAFAQDNYSLEYTQDSYSL